MRLYTHSLFPFLSFLLCFLYYIRYYYLLLGFTGLFLCLLFCFFGVVWCTVCSDLLCLLLSHVHCSCTHSLVDNLPRFLLFGSVRFDLLFRLGYVFLFSWTLHRLDLKTSITSHSLRCTAIHALLVSTS